MKLQKFHPNGGWVTAPPALCLPPLEVWLATLKRYNLYLILLYYTYVDPAIALNALE